MINHELYEQFTKNIFESSNRWCENINSFNQYEMETIVIIPETVDINKNLALEKLRINPLSDIIEPPVVISIDSAPTMTVGNFSLINGKAKSGKTFFLGAIVAAFLYVLTQLDKIAGQPQNGKNIALYFDTEQSPFHATRTIKRICSLTGLTNPKNLFAYGLRPLSPKERLEAIEEKISTTENIGLVVIDGIRDLLSTGINDEAEATSLTSKFLKWTALYEIHLIVLLHQNKTDQNARGHIGTELLNKAETTLSITKEKSGVFVVSCEYSRDVAFDDFAFTITDGLPVTADLPAEGQMKSKNPQGISDQDHFTALSSIFKATQKIRTADLSQQIKYQFGNSFGDNQCRNYITYYSQKEWVEKHREGKNVFYIYKRAIF